MEARVLDGLKEHLLQPELVAAFVEGFQVDMARARAAEKAERSRTAKKRMEIDRKVAALIRAIEDGLYQPSMKIRMQELEWERALLPPDFPGDDGPNVEVLLHPRFHAIYKRQIENLTASFDGPDKEAAFELLRSMIDHIELFPRKGAKGLDAVLHGELAAILQVCTEAAGKGKRPASEEAERQPSMVAGAHNHLYRTRIVLPKALGLSKSRRSIPCAAEFARPVEAGPKPLERCPPKAEVVSSNLARSAS